ncbi:hypothetical protein E7T06_01290 [Deinococcus sp. Arct2-2]|uniref:permease prefix domain 1-containing protein n=1 Tax=Deinococcus sp. Arct2-2 TaxID=2568653 RepID=UPI0010A59AE5|nr:permease prefix domain 1-containing protein [Deinococcus sp. Arct2-2]THF71619.1 hypothetical protein E7T06_01290 [Deinococcus sp. Arct2-2]
MSNGKPGHSGDIARYLQRSTRGLWGRQRRELRQELRGHLEARCQELRLAGLTPAEAIRHTLRELGQPEQVSLGMAQVYLLPQMARVTAIGALMICTAFLAITTGSRGFAQVQGYQPLFALPAGPYTYLDTQSLQGELLKAGVAVSGHPQRPVLTFTGQPNPVVVKIGADEDNQTPFVTRALLRDYATGKTYLDANTLAQSLLKAGLDVRVQGWQNPELQVGTLKVKLGTAAQPVDAYNLYSLALSPLVQQVGLPSAYSAKWGGVDLYSTHTLPPTLTQAQPDGVYALVSVMRAVRPEVSGQPRPLVLAFDLARPAADGRLTFALPYDLAALRLSSTVADLQQDARRLTDPAQWRDYASTNAPAHALLLRLSGSLTTGAANTPTFNLVPASGLSIGEQ